MNPLLVHFRGEVPARVLGRHDPDGLRRLHRGSTTTIMITTTTTTTTTTATIITITIVTQYYYYDY